MAWNNETFHGLYYNYVIFLKSYNDIFKKKTVVHNYLKLLQIFLLFTLDQFVLDVLDVLDLHNIPVVLVDREHHLSRPLQGLLEHQEDLSLLEVQQAQPFLAHPQFPADLLALGVRQLR